MSGRDRNPRNLNLRHSRKTACRRSESVITSTSRSSPWNSIRVPQAFRSYPGRSMRTTSSSRRVRERTICVASACCRIRVSKAAAPTGARRSHPSRSDTKMAVFPASRPFRRNSSSSISRMRRVRRCMAAAIRCFRKSTTSSKIIEITRSQSMRTIHRGRTSSFSRVIRSTQTTSQRRCSRPSINSDTR